MANGFWRGQVESGVRQPFDAADHNWVSITADEFFFEPYCVEFKPPGSGNMVIVFGDDDTRNRGVEVAMYDHGVATVWVPLGGRSFWCPSADPEGDPDEPWETRLQEFDSQTGEFVRD